MNKYLGQFLLLFIISICLININPVEAGDNTVLNQDIEYINVDLQNVLQSLAELGNFKVVIGPKVEGEVTLTLKHGVSVKDAVMAIARGYGYNSRWLGATLVMIGTPDFINSNFAKTESKTFQLKYADPVIISESIQIVVPKEKINIDLKTKEITVSGNSAELANVTSIINRMDRDLQPVNFEIKLEEMDRALWKSLQLNSGYLSAQMGIHLLSDEQLRFLKETKKQLLHTKPPLSCFDGQEGRLVFGDQFPVIQEASKENGISYLVDDLELGTVLQIMPQLSQDKLLIRIKAEVNSAVSKGPGQIGEVNLRAMQSVVSLEPGKSFVFSDIMQRQEYGQLRKNVPLTNFPILDSIYGKTNQTVGAEDTATEVYLIITPAQNLNLNPTAVNAVTAVTGTPVTTDYPQGDQITSVVEPAINTKQPVNEGAINNPAPHPEEVKPEVIVDIKVSPETIPEPALNTPPVIREPIPSSDPGAAKPQEKSGFEVKYTVKKGDTLTAIAKKYGILPEVVLKSNQLTKTGLIKVGTVLNIPVPADRVYIVKPKETLWRISKRYGTTMAVLKELNGITDETKVKIGQELVLPIAVSNIVNPQF